MARPIDLEVLESFKQAPVFAALPLPLQEDLARLTRTVELRAHDVLWREGDRALHLGLVLRGRVALEKGHQRRVMIDLAGPQQMVGEVAFSLGAAYQFDVRCLRRAKMALVPAHPLRAALRLQPKVAVALAFELAQQVLRLSRRLEALSAGSVERRLARVLLTLTERFGTPFPGGTLMPVRLRREDFAALGATTLESASRQISLWKKSGLLVPQPMGLLIRNLPQLRALSDRDEG